MKTFGKVVLCSAILLSIAVVATLVIVGEDLDNATTIDDNIDEEKQ